ncbi:hypothetical protein RFI_03858 [Reticulomyxa filosa]|uniref:Uncharacterized protein n=1 Tax=Reticulomyxa filosa TaxID=46433 RepID=X6P583_RETFI|nr:hypothetical protein RFI_03858 [Reticulomyxa filosa]|eukprot:ETO33249.1 hypothetical protein RFI_03858 [Reticulomyxa filosa]
MIKHYLRKVIPHIQHIHVTFYIFLKNLLLLIQNTITKLNSFFATTRKTIKSLLQKTICFLLKNENHKFVKLYIILKNITYFEKKTQLSSNGSKVISYLHDKILEYIMEQFNCGIALFSIIILSFSKNVVYFNPVNVATILFAMISTYKLSHPKIYVQKNIFENHFHLPLKEKTSILHHQKRS